MLKHWIDAAAARWGGAPYLEDAAGAGQLTFAGLQRSTRAWARCLDRAGIPPGGRVAIRLPEPLGYASALVAILGAGRVVVPLDPAAPAATLARVLDVARPDAVVGPDGSGLPPGPAVLRPPGPDEAGEPARAGRTPPAGGIFLCTSGTTGTPKGVLLRDGQLSHVAGCVAIHHRLTPADRGYCCLPLFHVNAEVVGLLATLAARACLVLDRRFSRREKIYPREIEDFLLAQPGVRSAAVVGARDEVLGERPVAYVVPAGPARPGQLADELRAACEAALPRPQRPAAFHLVPELPLGATGKVARARLRELASAQPDTSTRGRAAPAEGACRPTASATTARATATAAYRSGA